MISMIARALHPIVFVLVVLAVLTASAQLPVNPVLPGDHPDPTIVLVGHTYWTTSTSGDRTPIFPLYHSDDLVHWTAAGYVFPDRPAWAANSLWAPELVSDRGRYRLFYAGRKPHGPLCVAVASATQPAGPWQDHGPLVCQPDGSIDAAFARNEQGVPYLIWKEDGNSRHQPTPIWAQRLTADLLHVRGPKHQLITNDAPWEGGVVEGPFVLRHDGYFYLFYAGDRCCGATCDYAEGVARAKSLLGPWQKNPANPIIAANEHWRCPGHGSVARAPDGQDVLIYHAYRAKAAHADPAKTGEHAYPAKAPESTGRESLIDAITWGADGWPTINGGHGPSGGQ
jgi:xylan 1,4-beta-xylosidase